MPKRHSLNQNYFVVYLYEKFLKKKKTEKKNTLVESVRDGSLQKIFRIFDTAGSERNSNLCKN